MSKQDIEKRLGFAAQGVKAKFGRFNTEFGFLANQIKNQPDLAKKNIIVLAKKMGKEVDITRAEFEQLMQYAAKLGMETQVANAHDDVRPGFSRTSAKAKMAAAANWESKLDAKNLVDGFNVEGLRELLVGAKEIARKYPQYKAPSQKMADGINMVVSAVKQMKAESMKSARPGAKATFAASDIIVKKDGQYIYYYPEDDDRATFADDNGKGAYTVKSNRTGKPVSAKTYRSFQEAAAASNAMNEKLPPLKKAKSSRPGVKAKFEREVGRKGNKSAMIAKNGGYEEDSGWRAYVVQHHGAGQGESVLGGMRSYSTEAKATAAALRGLETSGLKAARPGAKTKMAANNVDLWNYLSKSDVQIARQTPSDLAMLKKYAQRALTMPDFTPPAYAKNGPSLHAMAKDTLSDIRAWEDSTSRERARYARPTVKAKA